MGEAGRLLIDKPELPVPVPQLGLRSDEADLDPHDPKGPGLGKSVNDQRSAIAAPSVRGKHRKPFQIAGLGTCLLQGDTTAGTALGIQDEIANALSQCVLNP